jgi:ArsR family metal-binding transcriptional regulator
MGTIKKLWRKLTRWFDRKGRAHLEEVKDIIRDIFDDMDINITDLFDPDERKAIADDIKARLRAIRDDLTEWIIDLALESLWDEVRKGFSPRRAK